jgi:hypothetical protein
MTNLLEDVNTRLAIAEQLDSMGSFASSLSKLILCADSHNLQIISIGFAELISQAYTNTPEHIETLRANGFLI